MMDSLSTCEDCGGRTRGNLGNAVVADCDCESPPEIEFEFRVAGALVLLEFVGAGRTVRMVTEVSPP